MTANNTGRDSSDWETINWDPQNAIQRAVEDYAFPWKGIVGETIQNCYDAWCTNRLQRGVIDKNQDLIIVIATSTSDNRVAIADNAGGMPETTFKKKFAGLNTPGEEKQGGTAGGSYGRGFYAIVGRGKRAEAETIFEDFHGGLEVNIENAQQREISPLNRISSPGTRIDIFDMAQSVINDLSDWGKVHRYIQERFQPLLEKENVHIKVEIDNTVNEAEPVDLRAGGF